MSIDLSNLVLHGIDGQLILTRLLVGVNLDAVA